MELCRFFFQSYFHMCPLLFILLPPSQIFMISASVFQQHSLSVSVPILAHPDNAICSISKILFQYTTHLLKSLSGSQFLLHQILTFLLAFTLSVILTQISHVVYFSIPFAVGRLSFLTYLNTGFCSFCSSFFNIFSYLTSCSKYTNWIVSCT